MPSNPDGWRIVAVVDDSSTFESVCATEGLKFSHGCGYYQLTQKESVAPTKKLVACKEDTSEVVAGNGAEVRAKLGIAATATSLSSADVPKGWTLYVNSTSANRKLKRGTTVAIHSPGESVSRSAAAVPLSSGAKVAVAAPVAKVNKPAPVGEDELSKKRKKTEATPPPPPPTPAAPAAPPAAAKPTKTTTAAAPASGDGTFGSVTWHNTDSDGWRWHTTLMAFETSPAFGISPAPKASAKIAAFDYDGCLANTSLFKKGPDAWAVLFPSIPEVLRELHENGYRLVIMSNQSMIGKATKSKDTTIAEKKGRFIGFVKAIGLPFTVFAATADAKLAGDPYRKPACGMWSFLEAQCNGGIAIDRKKSFFVGDACGRKGDHSDSDLKCAVAFGVPFFNEKEAFVERKYKSLL